MNIIVTKSERTDLPIPYGGARCLPDRLPEAQQATVVAHVRVGAEQNPRKVVFPVPHPDPLLARLLRDECSEHLIKQAADISFGPGWKRVGDAMHTTLTLTRRGKGAVTVHRIDGTTHYIAGPVDEGTPIAQLDATARSAQAAVQLTPGRCDPHAFAEAKKAFLFPVRASVDGGAERVVIVVPPEDVQHRLIEYALDVCGLPTS
ncbi:hypothetical protein ACQEUU_17080 [Nonomuraea sp. CA-218870]|uniref:hypothetical protein n=1 Tax=Nonomuraea sp. CA-218870 TaxID=3239998 RepID=UPI003D90A6F4